MDTTGFRVCPFCRSPVPLHQQRCPECRRSLAGLPLKVHAYPPSSRPPEDWTPSPGVDIVLGTERRTRRGRRSDEGRVTPSPAAPVAPEPPVVPSAAAVPSAAVVSPAPAVSSAPAERAPWRRPGRMPLMVAAGLVMALALGWIAVGAGGGGEDGGREPRAIESAADAGTGGEPARPTAVSSGTPAAPTTAEGANSSAAPEETGSGAATPTVASASTPETAPASAAQAPASAGTSAPPPTAAAPPSTAATAPEPPSEAEVTPLVVQPEVLTPPADPARGEDERLRQARVAALDLALERRGALVRRIERLEEELAVIQEAEARDKALFALEDAHTQLEIANREVARLRAETRPRARNRP